MIGQNSKESYQGATYDIQTQHVSEQNLIETRIYRNGKILATVRTDCPEDTPAASLEETVNSQHEEIRGKIREGSYALIFLWISRGIIAFESKEYLKSLECFESVMAIDETHEEANEYLDKIQGCLEGDEQSRREIVQAYQEQKETLVRSGRNQEAGRKEAFLTRLCPGASPSSSGSGNKGRKSDSSSPSSGSEFGSFFRAGLLSVGFKPGEHNRSLWPKHVLVSCACLLLIMSSGLILTDIQVKLDPEYHQRLGQEYLDEGKTLPARNIYCRLLRQDPGSEEALIGWWETFRKIGDYAEAIGPLEELMEEKTSPLIARFTLAEAYRMSLRCSDAVAEYREALQAGGPETSCKMGIGLCLLNQQKNKEAIKLWKQLQKKGEKDYRLDYCLGMAYQNDGRLGRASYFFSQALKKQPQSAHIYRALGNCLHGMHQEAKAQKLWEKADQLLASTDNYPGCFNSDLSGTESGAGTPLPNCLPFPLI
jgi:tetratricopeptide (TPR) repeat protein